MPTFSPVVTSVTDLHLNLLCTGASFSEVPDPQRISLSRILNGAVSFDTAHHTRRLMLRFI